MNGAKEVGEGPGVEGGERLVKDVGTIDCDVDVVPVGMGDGTDTLCEACTEDAKFCVEEDGGRNVNDGMEE